MAFFSVILKPSTEKDLRRLASSVAARILTRIEALQDDPFPRQSIKLAGAEQLYRLRVGQYRVIYSVDRDAMQIVVQYIRHWRDAYRGL